MQKDKKVEEAQKEAAVQKKAKEIQKDAEVLKLLEEDEDDFEEFEEGGIVYTIQLTSKIPQRKSMLSNGARTGMMRTLTMILLSNSRRNSVQHDILKIIPLKFHHFNY